MHRKSTKTAPQGENSAQILEEQASKGKPEGSPAKGKKIGAPSIFTQHIADTICTRLSEGESLKSITLDEEMPNRATVYRWLAADPAFCDMYTRAREDQADTNADEILAIADEMPPEYTDEKGRTSLDQTYLAWQKQRIEARKWTAMKLKPKKYGERIALAGDKDSPVLIEAQVEAKTLFDSLLKNMELQGQAKANE